MAEGKSLVPVEDADFSSGALTPPKGAGTGLAAIGAGIGAGLGAGIGATVGAAALAASTLGEGEGDSKELKILISLTEVANRQREKLVSVSTSLLRMARAAAMLALGTALTEKREKKLEHATDDEDKDKEKPPGWFKKLGGFLGGTKIGKVGKAGLVGLMWVGIIQVVLEGIRFYLENLRGKPLGEWMDVLDKTKIAGWSVGGLLKGLVGMGIGWTVGKMIGGIIGTAVGGPVGMFIGAMVGGVIGAGIGALAGYFTSTDMYKGLKKDIGTWWESFKTPVFKSTNKWAVKGADAMKGTTIVGQFAGFIVGGALGFIIGLGDWISNDLIGDSFDPIYKEIGEAWDFLVADVKKIVKSIGLFFYTPGGREQGPPGTGAISAGTILGGTISLQFIQDTKNWVSNAWDKVSNFVSNIVEIVSDFLYTGPQVDVGGGVTRAKIFGGLVELHPEGWGAYFREKWDNLVAWLGNMVTSIADLIWSTETTTEPDMSGQSATVYKLFGMELPWPKMGMGATLLNNWNNLVGWMKSLVTSFGNWLFTGEKTETDVGGGVITTGMKIFGVQLPPLPSPGDVIMDGWNKLTKWVTDIGTWFWDGEALFGGRFTIPDWEMPEFPTMEEMKAKLFGMIAKIISNIPDMLLPASVEKWRDENLPGHMTAGERARSDEAKALLGGSNIYGGEDRLGKESFMKAKLHSSLLQASIAQQNAAADLKLGFQSTPEGRLGDFRELDARGMSSFEWANWNKLQHGTMDGDTWDPNTGTKNAAWKEKVLLANRRLQTGSGYIHGLEIGDDWDRNTGTTRPGSGALMNRSFWDPGAETAGQRMAGRMVDYTGRGDALMSAMQGYSAKTNQDLKDAQKATKDTAKDTGFIKGIWGLIFGKSTPHINVKIVDTDVDAPFVRIARGRDAAVGATKGAIILNSTPSTAGQSPPITIVNAPQNIDARQSNSSNSSPIYAGVNDPFGDMIPGTIG